MSVPPAVLGRRRRRFLGGGTSTSLRASPTFINGAPGATQTVTLTIGGVDVSDECTGLSGNTGVATVDSAGGGSSINARDFSGSSQYIAKANPTGILVNAAWTMGAWVNADAYGADGSVILKVGDLGDLTRGAELLVKNSGTLQVRCTSQGANGATTIGTGAWVRVGATRDNVGVALLHVIVNGVDDGSNNTDAPSEITTGDVFAVGDQHAGIGAGYLNGKAAWGFWLQGVSLPAATLDAKLQDPQSLIAEYGPSGTITANALKILWPMQCDTVGESDQSGVGNNGTVTGATYSAGTGPTPTTGWDPCA